MEQYINKIINADCLDILKELPDKSIDLTITSPPYDNLRSYNGNNDQWGENVWKSVINDLFRITKIGGVVVWVVGDSTINGSETGTSFKQALYAIDCGFKLHDTMIYRKSNYLPLNHDRYEQEWEYMFCFSKETPKTFNAIKISCTYAGVKSWGEPSIYKDRSGNLTSIKQVTINEKKIKGNIFIYTVGSRSSTSEFNHPAQFPSELAIDQIKSWSNEDDIVLDPFLGSGTTALACKKLGRRFIGIEKDAEYCKIAQRRIELDIGLFDDPDEWIKD